MLLLSKSPFTNEGAFPSAHVFIILYLGLSVKDGKIMTLQEQKVQRQKAVRMESLINTKGHEESEDALGIS